MTDARSLEGRVAFVTGAARGIGRGIALRLAAAGASVAVADLHPGPFRGERYYRLRERWSGPEEDEPAVDAVRGLGVRAAELRVDVSDAESVRAAVAACASELGPVDVLVNNAGIVNNIAPIASMSGDAWEHELRVNLTGAFHCIQATAPGMAERGWGRIVNIASVAARSPSSGQPAYAASKAGLIALTQSTAQEFGPRGVTANAVLPGLIATPLVMSMPEPLRAKLVGQVPVGRLGEPGDIGELVAFLGSPAASFLTATAIPCDGGFLGAPLGGLDE
jgi:3-oxoacyl-[acyl-carrier protein] reductase